MKRKASELSISSESRIKIQKIDELDDETTTFSMYKAENYNEILEFYNLEKINGNRYFSSEEKEQSSSKFFAWIKEIRIGVGINVAINKKEKETFYFKEEIENFMKSKYQKSLDDYGVDISNALSDSLNLPGFVGKDQVDATITPKWLESYSKNCIISIKFTKLNNESNVKGQALAHLLSLSILSKYPVLHVTTDLKKYQLSFIYYCDIDKAYYFCEKSMNRDQAIPKIVYWLMNFYPNAAKLSWGNALKANAQDEKEINISFEGLIKAKDNLINISKVKTRNRLTTDFIENETLND